MRRMYEDNEIKDLALSQITPANIETTLEGDTGISVELNADGDAVRVGIDMTGATAGKILTANATGTDVEWKDASTTFPTTGIKIGDTTLSEEQLIGILALLSNN